MWLSCPSLERPCFHHNWSETSLLSYVRFCPILVRPYYWLSLSWSLLEGIQQCVSRMLHQSARSRRVQHHQGHSRNSSSSSSWGLNTAVTLANVHIRRIHADSARRTHQTAGRPGLGAKRLAKELRWGGLYDIIARRDHLAHTSTTPTTCFLLASNLQTNGPPTGCELVKADDLETWYVYIL